MSATVAVKFSEAGGAEVLEIHSTSLPKVGPTEVVVRHEAIGVNFVDTYYRSGLYKVPLPSDIGSEAAGVIEEVGPGVNDFKVGDRVAYATGPLGSYATRRLIDEKFLVSVPDTISFELAASSLLKGLTVQYLFESVFPIKKGQRILFHAAAGGVGLLACQWAKSLGVDLIGTVSSPEKGEIALKAGAWKVINYTTENVSERVRELTDGAGVPVVYDSVGKTTWDMSLASLASRGMMVSFGNASGPVTGVDLVTLAQHGSLFVTRPILAHYVSTPGELRKAASQFFELMAKGVLTVESIQSFKLVDAVKAHHELVNRERTGPIILIP